MAVALRETVLHCGDSTILSTPTWVVPCRETLRRTCREISEDRTNPK
jgi:hypothetical protein